MKKTLHIFGLLLCLLLLASCSLLSGGGTGNATTAPVTTTSPVTTAPPASSGEDADALLALLADAVPTRADATVTSAFRAPDVTLSAAFLLLHTEELDYYSYEIERLLPLEEALLAGSPTETLEGHLTIDGEGNVTSSSAEITSELLSALPSLSLRLPALESALFSECRTERTGSTVTVGGSVKEEYIPHLLAPYGTEAEDLSLSVTLDAVSFRPTALLMTYTSADGAAVTLTVTYSYGAVTIPE